MVYSTYDMACRDDSVCNFVGGREKGPQNRSLARYALVQKADGCGHARKNEERTGYGKRRNKVKTSHKKQSLRDQREEELL